MTRPATNGPAKARAMNVASERLNGAPGSIAASGNATASVTLAASVARPLVCRPAE
jgi:hypothetical protein